MADREWTAGQKQCFEANGTVLVSAAAGSGKTAVLVERVIRLITDPVFPVEVDRLLVVTFTKAAAAEMKGRIAGALNGLIAADPGNRRLRTQLMKLPQASISTVHSFCADLIRENFHRLPAVSPRFRLGEEAQTAPLRAAAMEEVLEEAYAQGDPAFLRLLDILGGPKDDRALAERVEALYEFVQADPAPHRWLAQRAAMYRCSTPPEESPWGREILAAVTDTLDWCARLCQRGIRLAERDETVAPLGNTLKTDLDMILDLKDGVETCSWDEALALLRGATFGRAAPIKKDACTDPDLKEQVAGLREQIKKKVQALPELMGGSREDIGADTAELAPCVEALCELVRRFSARYGEKKAAADLLDFNDLEHFALQLLTQEQEGELRPTHLAEEVAARFAWVMVDEYQDTNPTQEALFRAVSRHEENLFFVGDVKQSIYAFRNATPELFIARRDRYPAFDGAVYPALIRLGHNFRSRRGVTDTANFICGQLMTPATCGVNYAVGEQLVYAASYSEKEETAELMLVDPRAGEPADTPDALEAAAIVRRLKEMKETLTIQKEGEDRPMGWGDVCILLRSAAGRTGVYADALRRAGIPALSGSGSGFFTAPEVTLTLSLLAFLDNPLEEISLLAVLMSPLFAFTPDDMTALREQGGRDRSLYTLLRRCSREEGELADTCRDFLQVTDRLRTRAAVMPADRLLGVLYEELGLIPVMSARTHGEQRTANLQKLMDMARSFEQAGCRGLSAFVRYLDRERERDQNAQPAPVTWGEDAVRIMSIHASKGLEFPVVFLAGLGHQFNLKSVNDPLLLHRQLGVGMRYYDGNTLVKRSTLQRRALSRRIRRDERAEDLRILYVAVTRARERLCFVITGSPEELAAKAAAAGEGTPLPAGAVMEASSLGEWVLMALLRHPAAGDLRRLARAEETPLLPCESGLTVTCLRSLPPQEEAGDAPGSPPPDAGYLAALRERLTYVYPYKALGSVPAKLAASELAHRQGGVDYVATARPAFFSESDLTPAERGTAVHQFMQFADYAKAAADTEGEIARLVQKGFLSAPQGKSLPRSRLKKFFTSDLYRRIAASDLVLREYAFTVERPAVACLSGLPPEAAGEQILIQGIADCVFREAGGFVIVDYKTDRVSSSQELAERYRPQLAVYRQALEQTLEAPVNECLLYSFSLNESVPVEW